MGGVSAGAVISARDQFAEQNVHNQNMLLGSATQDVNSLTQLQNLFPVSQNLGYRQCAEWPVFELLRLGGIPNDSTARQTVMQ